MYAGFATKVLAYDPYHNHALDFLQYKNSLIKAIKHPHIISLHLPPNKQTFHLFHKQIFPKLNKPPILLNPPPPPLI
ncbi:NAD(P)-dependent oxidoreductase, partial [Staphylococcus capitis]|uniref:NAD(P)-dependent oxidoreductase n=1 Tax=Staphylococcus capitis TaxID=29388 RepID=UPI0028CB6F20